MNRILFVVAIALSFAGAARADFASRCAGELSYGDSKTVSVLFAKAAEKELPNPESCLRVGRKIESKISLDLSAQRITNIEILAEFPNLQILNLAQNEIENIGPVAALKGLKVLLLSKNRIVDLEPLRDLRGLTHLELGSNFVTTLRALEYLENLRTLSLTENKVTDLESLAYLPRLQFLWIAQNQVRDVRPLSDLRDLRVVSLAANPVVNYHPLFPLTDFHVDSQGERIRLDIIGIPVRRPLPAPCVTVPSCGPCGAPVRYYSAPRCGY